MEPSSSSAFDQAECEDLVRRLESVGANAIYIMPTEQNNAKAAKPTVPPPRQQSNKARRKKGQAA